MSRSNTSWTAQTLDHYYISTFVTYRCAYFNRETPNQWVTHNHCPQWYIMYIRIPLRLIHIVVDKQFNLYSSARDFSHHTIHGQ